MEFQKHLHVGARVGGPQRFKVSEVAAVHGQNQVVGVKIFRPDLAGALGREIKASGLGVRNGARIWRLADMIAMRARRSDFDHIAQSGVLDVMPQDAFGRRGAADVSRTHE